MLCTLIILFAVIDCNNCFFEFFQEYQNGDVVMYNYDNAPNYYFIKTIQNIDNYTDYPFKINKINDIGLILIDITLKAENTITCNPVLYIKITSNSFL